MIQRAACLLSAAALLASCGHSAPAERRPTATALLAQARDALSQTSSFHAHVSASLQPYGEDGKPFGNKSATDFNGWVAGEKASGTGSVAGTPAPVIRIGDHLYTQWTAEYLREASPDLIAKCENRWIVQGSAAGSAALFGAVTKSEILRLFKASDTPRDLGETEFKGRSLTRLQYTSEPGVTITLYLTRGKQPLPTRVDLNAPTKFTEMTTELDRYGQAPPIAAPANAVEVCS